MTDELFKEVILTIGASSSGKSIWAEQYAEENDYVNINRDDIRFSLFTDGERNWNRYKFSNSNERRVTAVAEQIAFDASVAGQSIIISDTNINPKIRKKWEDWAKENGYKYSEVLFECNWQTLVKRNAQREGGLTENLLWSQYKRYMQQFGTIGNADIDVYEEDNNLPYTNIVDLDGTVAQMNSRKPFEWSKVSEDSPRHEIIHMVQAMGIKTGHITFMSGRDGCCYEDTKEWIERYIMDTTMDGLCEWGLHMREPDDYRKDDEVKYELFDAFVRYEYNVATVFDDRKTILRLWELLGLPNIIDVGGYQNEF